jgi:hypothetical protein
MTVVAAARGEYGPFLSREPFLRYFSELQEQGARESVALKETVNVINPT